MMQLTNKARITQLEKRFRASNKARIVSEITARQAQERLDAGEELLDADELSSDSDDSFDLEKDAEMKKERKAQRQLKRAQKKKKEPKPILKKEPKASKTVMVCVCKAIKMDGQPCGARAKNGAYCARHSKK